MASSYLRNMRQGLSAVLRIEVQMDETKRMVIRVWGLLVMLLGGIIGWLLHSVLSVGNATCPT